MTTAARAAPLAATEDAAGKPASLRLIEVADAGALETFIRLPARLYRGHPGFVAPLALERRESLSAKKNPYFSHATTQFWLAMRGDQAVGRISAQIDRLSLERHGKTLGHFGLLDAENDPATVQALVDAAETWLRGHGMDRVRGPFNLSINEECGLLVDGFESRSVMMMGYAPPYLGPLLQAQGYAKAKDLLAYDYDIAEAKPVDPRGILKRVTADGRVRVRPIDMKRYRADLSLILDVFNDAWSENWGFLPFTEAEIVHAATSMRPLISAELVWIAEVDGEPAAMIVCLPNLNEAIADLGGNVLPFGWAKLLWRLKVSGVKSCRVPLFGVRKRYHRSPLGAALILLVLEALRVSAVKAGFEHAELSWILEDNAAIRGVIEHNGARVYKTYRIYEKSLA
jgi:hypothetical protein